MPDTRPLTGLRVVNLGLGMAAAIVGKFLSEGGAEVVRAVPTGGDPFGAVYPAYEVWRRAERIGLTLPSSDDALDSLLGVARVCIVGGEEHPLAMPSLDIQALAARHPRLVFLDITAYPPGDKHRGRRGVDILVQARSGAAFEHYSNRPALMAFQPANMGAALNGLIGLLAALIAQEADGLGQVVSTSLYEGAIGWMRPLWFQVDKPTPQSDFSMPKDPRPLILECADGIFIHVVLGARGAKYGLYSVLGIDDPAVTPGDPGLPNEADGPEKYFGDLDRLAPYAIKRTSAELLKALLAADVPAAAVLTPGRCWDDPQVAANGIIATSPEGWRYVGNPIGSVASVGSGKRALSGSLAPLGNIRVVDFGAFVAGPAASVPLGDLGADVIKVESLAGDPNRGVMRTYSSANRGKRSLALDMKSPEGQEIAARLCATATVVTSNFRPGVSARLGIDPASLHAITPDLIVLESPGYGSQGPLKSNPAFDLTMQAYCGHEHRAGGRGNTPLWSRAVPIDFGGGQIGAIALLMALYGRTRTGDGAVLEVSLLNAGLFLLSELVQDPQGAFMGAQPLDHEQLGFHPAERFYKCLDGWIAVAARGEAAGQALWQCLDLPSPGAPIADWGPAETQAIASVLANRTTADVLADLDDVGVWNEACRLDAEVATLSDPTLIARGTIAVDKHPRFGNIREIGPLFRFSRSQRQAKGRAAELGEHTQAILSNLGYMDDEIMSFYERGIVR